MKHEIVGPCQIAADEGYRIWTGRRNAVGGVDSDGTGWVFRTAPSAQVAADEYASELRKLAGEEVDGTVVIATNDDGESAETEVEYEDEDEGEDEDVDIPGVVICAACGGPAHLLGSLGAVTHYRCRDCGQDNKWTWQAMVATP